MKQKLKSLLILTLFLLSIMTINSCQDDDEVLQDNPSLLLEKLYKAKILNYTNSLKKLVSKNESNNIGIIEQEIDFTSMSLYDLNTTEKIIVANKLKSKTSREESLEKYIFFLNKDEITRGNIVVFKDEMTFNKHDQLLVNILNRERDKLNYFGEVTFFTPTNQKYLENTFQNGEIIKNGVLSSKNKENARRGITSCTDWYWVTTYASGAQTWEYLYTTCVEDCTMLRFGYLRSDCGGGGGGGGGTGETTEVPIVVVFPENPFDKQFFEITTRDRVFTRYQYNAQTGTWETLIKTIPAIVVASNPQVYPAVVFTIPTSMNQTPIPGPEGLEYTYDFGSGCWVGTPQQQQVSNPCEELKDLTNPEKANIKPDIEWLKEKVNRPTNKNEFGVEFRKELQFDGSYKYINTRIESSNEFNVTISTGTQNIGGAHTHPLNSYKMFSYGDVKLLSDMYQAAGSSKKNEVVYMLICKDIFSGQILIYGIKVDNFDVLYEEVYKIWDNPKYNGKTDDEKLEMIHKQQAKKYDAEKNNLEKSFLQQFGGFGISLYKTTDDTITEWNKLNLDINPVLGQPKKLIVKPTPCN